MTVLLILSSFAVTTISVSASSATQWGSDFEDGVVVGSPKVFSGVLKANVTNAESVSVDNPVSSIGGKVVKTTITANGGSANIDTEGLPQINTGTMVFDIDFYLASSYATKDGSENAWVTIMPYNTSSAVVKSLYFRLGSGSTTSTDGVLVSPFPRDKWVTVRYVFNYTSAGKANVKEYLITDDQIWPVNEVKNVSLDSGIYKIRFQANDKAKDSVFYLDNARYYEKPQVVDDGFSINDETHFVESFSNGISYNLSARAVAATEGIAAAKSDSKYNLNLQHHTKTTAGGTGTAKTVADPAGSARTVLEVDSVDSAAARNRIETTPAFDKYVKGIQVAEVDLYLPADQMDKGDANRVFVCAAANGTFSGVQFYLEGDEAVGGSGTLTKTWPRDEWFTARLTLNYTAKKYEMAVVKNDGTKSFETTGALPSSLQTYGLSSIWVDGGGCERSFYIGAIRYYQKGSYEVIEDFEDATTDMLTLTKSNVRYCKSGSVNSGNPNGKSWFVCIAGNDSGYDGTKASTLDIALNDVSVRGGITIASVDFWMNGNRNAGEEILIYAQTYDMSTSSKINFGKPIRIQKDKVWYGDDANIPANAVSFTKSEWYTLRITYNHDNNYYRYEMIKADGTAYVLGSGYASAADVALLEDTGVCGLAIDYDRAPDSEYNGYYWYIDNMKLNNIVLDDFSFDKAAYKATLKYATTADTTMGKLLLAQYGTGGELISLQTAVPAFAKNSAKAFAQFSKADGATDAKLMYWADATDTLMPLFAAK